LNTAVCSSPAKLIKQFATMPGMTWKRRSRSILARALGRVGSKHMQLGLFAFAAACAFVGAALYISVVEQPVRLTLNAGEMVREWTPSNRRGFVMLSALAIASSILAYADYARTGDVRWIIGGTIMLATWAYAYFVIMPVNIELYALERDAPALTLRELMRDWGLLEWGHTVIGVWASGVFAWALIMPA
jgi:hypothetical protein